MFLYQILIQIMAFVRKELFGSVRQPRLVLSLVLGPFLILALFGLGYEGNPHYNTTLVVPDKPGVSTDTTAYKNLFKQTFNLTDVSNNSKDALNRLNNGQTDVVIEVPENALETIYSGNYAKFPVYYRNLNPIQANYIEYSTYVFASEFDKVLLRQAIAASKPQNSQLAQATAQLNGTAEDINKAMQSGNIPEAKAQAVRMRAEVQVAKAGLSSLILPGAGTVDSQEQNALGGELSTVIIKSGVGSVQSDMDNIDTKLNALDAGFNKGDANSTSQRANIDNVKQSSASATEKINRITSIPPAVLVEPVRSDAKNMVASPVSYINFYGPAVVILLLQHIAITLASLSNVRDRLIGAIEIFRVAPIGPTQILTGKFLGYTLLLLGLGAILIAVITQLLGVPFINFNLNWLNALLVLFATIYASIGLGYLVGGLSRTESQTVQLSMIILLASIFFTGFVVPLTQFNSVVRYVGYVLPMTYGSQNLQNVMLDYRNFDPFFMLMPFAIGTIYHILGRILYRHQLKMG